MGRGREDRAGFGGINALPLLVMVKIFRKLDPQDILSCETVCSKWKQIIDRELGSNCLVGPGNPQLWKNMDMFQPLKTIRKIPIRNCVVSGLLPEKVPKFKYPRLVRTITFDSQISSYNFHKLIYPLINLRELSLGNKALCEFDINGTMGFLSKSSPKIHTLKLNINSKESLKAGVYIRNVTVLLKQMDFPHLKTLSVLVPICEPCEEYVVGTVMNCIQKHNEQLRELHLGFFSCCLESLGELTFPAYSPCNVEDLKIGRLQSFYYYGNDKRSLQSLTIVSHLFPYLAQQTDLRDYQTIAPHPILPFPCYIIFNNYQTLVSLQICYKCTNDGFVVNCTRHLKKCTSLRFFTMIALTRDPTFLEDQPDLTHAHGFPKSLESIQLIGVHCTKTDLHTMAVKLPKLKILNLICIGTEFDFGMTLLTISQILRQKVIQDFHVSRGVNKLDCRCQPFFPDEEHPVIKEMRRAPEKSHCFHLNSLKTYISGSHKSPKDLFKWSDKTGRSNYYFGSVTSRGSIEVHNRNGGSGDGHGHLKNGISCMSLLKNGITAFAEAEEWKMEAVVFCAKLLLPPVVIALL